ncbi:hypothetical protein [Pseudarthrobacter sp. C4D7]|uniref:hypothetical protein n=1 Tax=Pseudarthrobacter sp. C4D7 TaxID=2735268 RepID=UPI0015855E24|nr:hypothetical protein [Pseudarthrobacter sp. C4D7]NUT72428.1 hypothetical protein [Pseudarthrobacter sp. C4D7]
MKRSTMMGTAVAAALCLASSFCLASCSAQQPAQPTQPTATGTAPAVQEELVTKLITSDGGTKAVTVETALPGPQVPATVAGQVSRDGAGCITLTADDGTDWTLLFPSGTTLNGEAAELPDGTSLAQGEQVSLDGSRVPADEGVSMCLNYARLLSVEKAAASR